MASSPMDALGQVLSGLGEQFYQYSKERAAQDIAVAQHEADKNWQSSENEKSRQAQLEAEKLKVKPWADIQAARDAKDAAKEAKDEQLKQDAYNSIDTHAYILKGIVTTMDSSLSLVQMDQISKEVSKDPMFQGTAQAVQNVEVKRRADKEITARNKALAPQALFEQNILKVLIEKHPGHYPLGISPETGSKLMTFDPSVAVNPAGQFTPGTPTPSPINPKSKINQWAAGLGLPEIDENGNEIKKPRPLNIDFSQPSSESIPMANFDSGYNPEQSSDSPLSNSNPYFSNKMTSEELDKLLSSFGQ